MNRHDREDTLALDPQNPWLGLFSYTEDTRAYFHGRDEEAAELARRVQRKNLTILFGQSGLGKTSLLRAGLVPRLRPQGYCPVYVRVDYAPDSPAPAEQIKQAIRRETTQAGVWTRTDNTVEGESLWEFLHHRGDLLRDADGKPLIPLLIFDQFEEVFTLAQADDAGRARAHTFLADLADLVENRPPEALEARLEEDDSIIEDFDFARADYRILIALREDYLAHLESVKDLMPSITQNRMRLARMTGAQALSAVVEPGGKLVSREVAESIVRFVAGGSELANAEIEPSLLSLVCRELNNARIAQGRGEISADLLAGSRDTILTEFYERALADQPDGVRRVVEDELLTESGYRESLAEERVVKALEDAGAAPGALATLVNRRLLRIEDRLDMRRVELTHDVLCGVVMASRNLRHEREARDNAQRQLAEQKAREEAAHRAMLRARTIATVCAVLMLVAIAGALFGWFNYHRAQAAEAQAQDSRANAEKLVGFLIEDFYYELAPTGRLQTLGQLAKRTVAYYDSLPSSMVTPQSRINRAMALLREAQAQQNSGQIDASKKTLEEGHGVFEKLWKQGNHSEKVAYGLALSQYIPATRRDFQALGTLGPALKQAMDVLRPLVNSGKANPRTRLLYADVLNHYSVTPDMLSVEQRIPVLEEALKVLKGIGALDLSNLDAASSYADVADSEARGLDVLGHTDQAWQLEQKAYALETRLLDKRPGDVHAMFIRTESLQFLSELALERHDSAAGLDYAQRSLGSADDEVHYNPASITARMNRVQALLQLARVHGNRGDMNDAIDAVKRAVAETFDKQHPLKSDIPSILGSLYNLASLQAQSGDLAASKQTLLKIRPALSDALKDEPPNSPLRQAVNAEIQLASDSILRSKDWQAQLQNATQILKRMDALDTAKGTAADIVHNGTINLSLRTAATSSLKLGDFQQAEGYLKRFKTIDESHGNRLELPGGYKANFDLDMALSLIGQGKVDEARPLLKYGLDYFSGQYAKGQSSPAIHQQYAYALYVDALGQPDTRAGRRERKSLLAKAAQALASAPGQGPQMTTLREMAQRIATAQQAH